MQQFIESAEKECENDDAELDAKRTQQDCVMALRQLFQDFESQLKGDVDQAPMTGKIPIGSVLWCSDQEAITSLY